METKLRLLLTTGTSRSCPRHLVNTTNIMPYHVMCWRGQVLLPWTIASLLLSFLFLFLFLFPLFFSSLEYEIAQ
jgi:hypothetical protein